MPNVSPSIRQTTTGTTTQLLTTAFHAPVALIVANANDNSQVPNGIRLSAIYIHVHAIAAGCTALTVRISPDAGGDEILVPDTQATLSTGYTTPARGGVVYKIDVDAFLETSTIYWTVKTNLGTATLKDFTLTYERI
jgi:archaellin